MVSREIAIHRHTAYVDAENSFGAKLRSPYSMDLRFSLVDQKWFAENVAIAR